MRAFRRFSIFRARLAILGALIFLAPLAARAQAASTPTEEALERLEAWDIEGAEEVAARLAKDRPDDPGTKFVQGRVAFELGEYDRAVELLGEALGPGANESRDYEYAVAARDEVKGMVVEESAHFIVRYKPGKDAALVPYAIETMESAWKALTEDLGYAPPRKVRIEFYSTPKALARVSSLTEENIKATGTIALCKYNRLMVTSPRALFRGYEWQDTITHEFIHFLITRKSANTVPIWLHEGMAKYLETRWRGKAGLALDAGSEALLARAVKKDALITFARMHPSIAMLPTQEDAALAFAEVFTAIEFVDRKLGMAGLRAIIDGLKAGKSDHDAVAAALGTSFEKFEAEWRRSLKTRPAPKGHAALERLVFRDDKDQKKAKKDRVKSYERGELGTLPDPDARKWAHLGELLRARNRLAAAAVEYEKAIQKVGASHGALARKYALTLLALGRGAEAEKTLRTTLASEPEDDTNNLLLGRILVQTGRHAEARQHFLIANRRDPFDDEIHAGLLDVGRATGDAGLEARERDVLAILKGQKLTWRAAKPGDLLVVGYLRIEAPAGANVLIDGTETGLTTPVEEHALPAGRHAVTLVLPDGKKIEHAVDIVADELTPVPAS